MAKQGYYGPGGVWVPGDEETGMPVGGGGWYSPNPQPVAQEGGSGWFQNWDFLSILKSAQIEEARKKIAEPQRRWYETFLQQRMNAPGRFYSSLLQPSGSRPGISGPRRESIAAQNINNLAATLSVPKIGGVMGGE